MEIKIIGNFIDTEDFAEINSLKLKDCPKNQLKVYNNTISDNLIIKTDCFENDFLKKLNKKYHPKAVSILNDLCPEKLKLYDYSEFNIIETGKDCRFPIHDDTPNKLLSGVVYLKPEKNLGTSFYKNKFGDNKKTIDWKPNRAVFFSRREGESWHSYEGDNISNRLVLVYNLMTKRIKEVYQIEKKSYFLGNLRYRLNPYIYRYLKITL